MTDGQTPGSTTDGSAHPSQEAGTDGTQRLMNWSTVAAMVGLGLSAATLVFTIWFSHLLKKQAELLAPAAQMAAAMDSDISRSIAALRGWLAYGDPRFVEERREVWKQINKSYEDFRRLAEPQLQEQHLEGLDRFRTKLNELKYAQWAIEDVAHTPGNEPAAQAYDRHVMPIRQSIIWAFLQAVEPLQKEFTRDPELFFQLVVFHAQFMATDYALQKYVREPSQVNLQAYGLHAREIEQTGTAIVQLARKAPERERRSIHTLARFVVAEFAAYQTQAVTLTRARSAREGTVAQTLYRYRAKPLAELVSQRMRYISKVQAHVSTKSAHMFRVLGLVVVAGALLIGLMSASTLYVSFRIRHRVSRVLDRAKKLGQYGIEKKLGAGGMGEVYLARHALLRRPAAVKLLRGQNRASKRAKEKFRTEVQLTSRLTHPNTVEIFDYGVTPDGVFYYAMEYLQGATLQEIVDITGPMPSARVIHILRQVSGSLQEAHDLGLLHRDIKPGNIMLCTLGGIFDTAKVLDFGLVAELNNPSSDAQDEQESRLEGTPLYLAPETILEANGSEARSDLYAVGAVGYFLLCGSPPFEGHDVVEVLCQHLSDPPQPPSERSTRPIDPALEQIVLQCLEKDPELRPASARELRTLLDHCDSSSSWTETARETWWAEFGEVIARNSASRRGKDSVASSMRDDFAIRVNPRTTPPEAG